MRKLTISIIALALAATGLVACGGSSSGGGGSLSLVAYSTPKEAYADLIPAFDKTAAGKGTKFTQSYGASGDQSRAVDNGLKADIVAFSLEPDVTRLVDDGIVDKSWNANATKGMVTDSVVALAVRKGNPKGIKTWEDLVKPGVQVLTPNPFTSGGARWNVMAAYGSQIVQGKTPQQAEGFLGSLFKNVVVQDKAARDALQTFASGKGDVLIAYENEAIAAQQKGIKLDYVIPDQTILIENPIAVTKRASDPKKAQAFVDFLKSPDGQTIFAKHGYRPVDKSLLDKKQFPTPKQLFDITKFGGWSTVSDKFFDPQKGVMAGIEEKLGVSTGG
ncbi:MAG: sulfate/thiosulfate transport system substrate-binding protein [Thermoleophilaceae bacterium]|nr:sulfate/thiosulfate transport system substrate-binding protein [Thermoleophilaceae bacterium]